MESLKTLRVALFSFRRFTFVVMLLCVHRFVFTQCSNILNSFPEESVVKKVMAS